MVFYQGQDTLDLLCVPLAKYSKIMPFKFWLYSGKKKWLFEFHQLQQWLESLPEWLPCVQQLWTASPCQRLSCGSIHCSACRWGSAETAVRLHLLFSSWSHSSVELCGNHSSWYWLLSGKCLVGTNGTWPCAPTLCTLYGEPSVSCLFSAKGRSNSHSSLSTQVTGFGVLPKIRQAPQLAVYEE